MLKFSHSVHKGNAKARTVISLSNIDKEKKKSKFFLMIPNGPEVGISDEQSAPDRRARVRASPGACKIRRGCNVFQVPIQMIPLGETKRRSHFFSGGSKLRWHVSGSSFGMNPKPSAIADLCSSSPTRVKPTQPIR